MLDRGTVREQEGTLLVGISPSSSGIICVLPASAVLEDKAAVSSHRVGQADLEVVSSAWHGTFTIQAARPFRGKDKQVNESSSEPPSAISGRNLKKPLSVWVPWVAHPFQVVPVYSRNLWWHSVAQGAFQSRSLLGHIGVSLSVWYYRSSASSRFCPVDTGSSKGHFFPTKDRRLYELYDSYKCRMWILWPYSSTRYTFTVPAQQTSRNKVSPWSTDSLCGILSSNDI